MSKRVSLVAAVALLSVPSVAAAKDKLEPRVQAMLACQAISASEARLQCYDQTISALNQDLVRGAVVLKESNRPLAKEGVVKESGYWSGGRFLVVLDNGDRWAIEPSKRRREPPRPGAAVKLRKTLMGTYWISGPDLPETEAQFLGQGS